MNQSISMVIKLVDFCCSSFRSGAVVVAFFSFLLLLPGGVSGQKSPDRKKLEQEKQQIEEEIKGLKKMLSITSNDHKASLTRFRILENTINKRQQLIENLNEGIKDLDGQIAQISGEVKRLSGEYEALKNDYAAMIRAAQANRNRYTWLMFLLASDDFNQAYVRLRYYQQYSEFRKKQAKQIETTRSLFQQKKADLSVVLKKRIESRKAITNEKQKLLEEQMNQDKLVKSLASKKQSLEDDIRKKQIAADKLKKAIENVIAEEMRLAAERAKKNKSSSKGTTASPKNEASGVFDLTPAEQALAKSFSENRGRLPWPVARGYVVEEYGEHPHPVTHTVKTKNNGIDILSPGNSSAMAIFEGVVSRVIEVPGYHHVVIIRHGSYLSVYSNLLSVSVSSGQKVGRGDVLGVIAPDVSGQNSMVHFELWNGTRSVNPSDWLARQK